MDENVCESSFESLSDWLINCGTGALPATHGVYESTRPLISTAAFSAIEKNILKDIDKGISREWVHIRAGFICAQVAEGYTTDSTR